MASFREIVDNTMNDGLDDLALLMEVWSRNRAKDRTPIIVRQAILDQCAALAAGLPDPTPAERG